MSHIITIYYSDGQTDQCTVEEGSSTFAGTASHCDIKLSGPDVEPIHAMFTCVDGELKIQDWNTDGKTLLNNQPLLDEAAFGVGDEASIGAIRIAAGTGVANVTEPEVSVEQNAFDDDLHLELAQIRSSNSALANEFRAGEESSESSDAYFDDPFANGDTDLLRSEIEHLQLELAERDQQILSLQSCETEGATGVSADMEDTSRLVTRMEELLDELQSADDRLRTFEELLRFSDEATQAEQEERRQLESWVDQIEQRVAEREQEGKAEIERLNQRVREFVSQQKHNEEVLERALQQNRSAGGNASNELVESLQTQLAELQETWRASQIENDRLTTELAEQSASSSDDPATVAQLQQKLMELEIESSRERAEVARERAELARLQSELEQQLEVRGDASDSDVRLKAMREHLREIHSEEEVERESRRHQSLGGRIANLFSRIETR